ncbi:matrilin-4-like isoform X2 [Rhinatrema bivittatum]|uniref:matrilin-4-like isoform X2 n=1 Tax=Rhinatrema bivittatum TaxID=194408 RepID=UPI001129EC0C|nr:matrilin-4-like isoform X2 [Rhinatrema bivittatum]
MKTAGILFAFLALCMDLCVVSGQSNSTTCTNGSSDICVLVDGSNSMWPADFNKSKAFVAALARALNISQNGTRMQVTEFSDSMIHVITFENCTDPAAMEAALNDTKQIQKGTLTGYALQDCLNALKKVHDKDPERNQSIIVLTDGEPQDNVTSASQQAKAANITMYGIGVGDANQTQLAQMTGDPNNVFMSSYDALPLLVSQLSQSICTTASSTASPPTTAAAAPPTTTTAAAAAPTTTTTAPPPNVSISPCMSVPVPCAAPASWEWMPRPDKEWMTCSTYKVFWYSKCACPNCKSVSQDPQYVNCPVENECDKDSKPCNPGLLCCFDGKQNRCFDKSQKVCLGGAA